MLQSKANWKYLNREEFDQWMDDSIGYSPVIQELLLQRGITTKTAAAKFLSPSLEDLYKPEQLAMMDKAGERVHQAVNRQEKILIYGDYDADGVSSTAVLLKALKELGAYCDFYIPNRFKEGYGPNEHAFRLAHDKGFKLIITVDTGIASIHEANVAKELGIDLIITDHHEIQEELPDAFAIVHPKHSPDYPFQELAGVGVAFKFAEKLLGYFPKHLLEFAALGTIADLVPLISENRILSYYGLKALTETSNKGIKALKRLCNIEGKVTEEDVGFSLGPRINAVGRLQDAGLAVELFMTEDMEEARQIAGEIQEINQERQKIVAEIVREAEKMVTTDKYEQPVIIACKEGWNEGVLGIVASRLVQKYDRPAIVLAYKPESGSVKGSARSIPAFDLFANCMEVRELFTHFGGHAQAAGMTLPNENVPHLEKELKKRILSQLSEDDFKQQIEISQTLTIAEIDEALIKDINMLAPFGMKNPKPIIEVKAVPQEARQIGADKNHLKLQFREDNAQLDAIGFGMGNHYTKLTADTAVSIVGELGVNEWNGNRKLQIQFRDMKIDEWQLFDYRGKRGLNFQNMINDDPAALIVSSKEYSQLRNLRQITYQTEMESVPQAKNLYILNLPPTLEKLKELVKYTNPENIYVCYYIEKSSYLQALPSREDFKWLYIVLRKQKQLEVKKAIGTIMKARGWNKDQVIFMFQVFHELAFVHIENGIVNVSHQPIKKDLDESLAYKQRLDDIEIEKTLYYSSYAELKKWFSNWMDYTERPREGIFYGL
ncbi:single-stranded-DNA-specific exonuclease RecJ [Virgibacillus sp. YIM 98842]|uniref:single-stranded-DNA-specific exonuclease RecJ n=1 Tax=Virgibacillus sp. YIM 98842 TaxID=2663533 RepID=UPI0013D9D00F|nr:single-stranded-DNA-specific exonuclease RecJ [Virgibacillus sp. YIM 98842]